MTTTTKAAIIELLDQRGVGKTACPSEVARRLAGPNGNWRELVDDVHSAVDCLVEAGLITLSWKGKRMDWRRGPYRIARRQPTESASADIS
ncbi:MAG: DUF3253 domain-containing protein [Pseudomonadota bacterium]